ncbi:MAG: HAD-IIA family hydrolase [Galactobacter sp.]
MTASPMLADRFDGLLCDLDGVVYAGPDAVVDAIESLNRAAGLGLKIGFVTNNASRPAQVVADQLNGLGLDVSADQVFGSAAAAASLVADDVASRSGDFVTRAPRAMVVGSESLRNELRGVGVEVVRTAMSHTPETAPDYVVQGFDPTLGWTDLAAAAFAIEAGAIWVATNTDTTIPRAEGIAPGNGSLVAAVRSAVSVEPLVAGKPQPTLMRFAAQQLGLNAPLVIGDRLDTDVAGGVSAGFSTALVLTGIDTMASAAAAGPGERPEFVLNTLADLFVEVSRFEAGRNEAGVSA